LKLAAADDIFPTRTYMPERKQSAQNGSFFVEKSYNNNFFFPFNAGDAFVFCFPSFFVILTRFELAMKLKFFFRFFSRFPLFHLHFCFLLVIIKATL
jgi:hypothetical protein